MKTRAEKIKETKSENNKKLYVMGDYEVSEDKYQFIVKNTKRTEYNYFTAHMGVISFLLKRFNHEEPKVHIDVLEFVAEREKAMQKFEDEIIKAVTKKIKE